MTQPTARIQQPIRTVRLPEDQNSAVQDYLDEHGLEFSQLFELAFGTFFEMQEGGWPWRYPFLRPLSPLPHTTEPTSNGQA